ncbi:hypothetical protein ACFOY2_09315 [Nonomuraea purpurea]|uniref:Uncharacterized protein n=1 Tax=Nonomuraea purpurea TaxID=1849276 RepID=A0ABV8G2G8_9ACTN
MMYGPPPPEYPPYPRATSSPPIILLVSGLAALLGFLLGVFVGFGAGSPAGGDEPAPTVTMTVEDTPPPQPEGTEPAPSGPTQPAPDQTAPPQNSQPAPGQSDPAATPPGQGTATQPGQGAPSGSPPGINPASLRTLIVGRDIQPGRYRTTGPTPGFPACYWARLNTVTGGMIASGLPTGASEVTIQATDKAFQTGGCAEWTKA